MKKPIHSSTRPSYLPHQYHVFKGSSDTITWDTPLWRYLTFEKFCWLVSTSKLYHARLDQFEDPFEGSVTQAYDRERKANTNPAEMFTNQFEPWVNKSLRFRTYAVCWHASCHESDAQWRLYGSGGAGIAIVSTLARMVKAVDIGPARSGMLGEVEYIDFEAHNMKRKPFGTSIRPGFAKRLSFQHEREVRGSILLDLKSAGGSISMDDLYLESLRKEMPRGIVASVNLHELIQSIVISPLAAPYVEELVHLTSDRYGLDQFVRKSDLLGTPIY